MLRGFQRRKYRVFGKDFKTHCIRSRKALSTSSQWYCGPVSPVVGTELIFSLRKRTFRTQFSTVIRITTKIRKCSAKHRTRAGGQTCLYQAGTSCFRGRVPRLPEPRRRSSKTVMVHFERAHLSIANWSSPWFWHPAPRARR